MHIACKLKIMPSSMVSKIRPFFVDLSVYNVPFFSYCTEDQIEHESSRVKNPELSKTDIISVLKGPYLPLEATYRSA